MPKKAKPTQAKPLKAYKTEYGKASGKPAKWDWGLAKGLYMRGATREQILAMPEFKGMSKVYFDQIRWRDGWGTERQTIQDASLHLSEGPLVKGAIDELAKHRSEHFEFITEELRAERAMYMSLQKEEGLPAQLKRLDNLERVNDLAVKALHLDGTGPGDQHAAGLAFLSAIHSAPAGSAAVMAIVPLPKKENNVAGLIGAGNPMPEKQAQVVEANHPGYGPVQHGIRFGDEVFPPEQVEIEQEQAEREGMVVQLTGDKDIELPDPEPVTLPDIASFVLKPKESNQPQNNTDHNKGVGE